jgi:hypothetical protein
MSPLPPCFVPVDAKAKAAALVKALIADVSEGLRVFVIRDGVALTEAQITERARNICTIILGSYRVEFLPLDEDERAELSDIASRVMSGCDDWHDRKLGARLLERQKAETAEEHAARIIT